MSLPSASSILKRAREDTSLSKKIDDVYAEVIKKITKCSPVTLCKKGCIMHQSLFENRCDPSELQQVYKRIAKTKGYVVLVQFNQNGDFIPVPEYVWDWEDFWQTPINRLNTVCIRVEE